MILASFSSAEDVISNDVKKKKYIFGLQGTENPPFHFFGTRGITDFQENINFWNQQCHKLDTYR